MMNVKPRLMAFVTGAALSSAVLAHHSPAAFDTSKEVSVTGTITEYSFRNPHVYMTLAATAADGSAIEVEIEAGAGSVIRPLGFTPDAVKIGDVVTVAGNPGRRNPQGLLLGRELYTDEGTYYPLNISSRGINQTTTESANSVAGTWFSPRNAFFAYLAAAAKFPVTEQGSAAMLESQSVATPQKDCLPIGEPALMFYPVANIISVLNDRVEMKIDWLDSVRTIWLDGRDHPAADQSFMHGHAVGHWEGKVLVVDSANYTPNSIGLSMALPSSDKKHLLERFEVSEDGKSMNYSGVIEDPVYLSEPVRFSGSWDYRPDMQHSGEQCDLTTARRFLDD